MKSKFTILFLVLSGLLFSQEKTMGKEFKFPKSRTFFEGVIGKSTNKLLGVSVQYNKSKTNQLFLNTFDYKTLALETTNPILLPKSKKYELVPNQMFLVSGELYLICYKTYKKISSKVICAYSIDESGAVGKYFHLDSVLHVGSEDKDLYQIIQDKTEESILLFTKKLDKKKSEQYITIRAFDKSMNVKWSTKQVLKGVRKKLTFYDFQFDGKDRIYMMARNSITKGKELVERKLKNNMHQLWSYNKGNGRFKQLELKLQDKWIFDMRIKLGPDSSCYIGGLYADKAEYSLHGTIAVKIDKDFKVTQHALTPYTKETLKYINKKKDGSRSIDRLTLHSVQTNEKGDVIILAEQFSKDIEQYYDPLTEALTYTDVFHYEHGIISWFDQSLKLLNESPIKKNQSSSNDGGIYSSFIPFIHDDTLSLYYNDHPKNINIDGYDEPKAARTASLFVEPMVYKYTKNGYHSGAIIHDEVSINLIPKNSFQTFLSKPGYLLFEQNKRNLIIRIEAH